MTNVRLSASSVIFPGHEVSTVDDVGLKGLKNGDLLRADSGRFEVLITVDRNMPSQQNLGSVGMALIILSARPCRYPELKLLVPDVLEALKTIKAGDAIQIQ